VITTEQSHAEPDHQRREQVTAAPASFRGVALRGTRAVWPLLPARRRRRLFFFLFFLFFLLFLCRSFGFRFLVVRSVFALGLVLGVSVLGHVGARWWTRAGALSSDSI
jgi:hypothetical protein